MSGKPLIIAALPAYNEEKTIAKIVVQASRHVDEVLVVDDGSTDMTAEIAERLGGIVIRHRANVGYGGAMATIFKEARKRGVDVLVTLDADGQHDPGEIPKLIEPILRGEADIVVGSRFAGERGEMPRYRETGVKIITELTKKAAKLGLSDAQSGYRAYSKESIGALTPTEQGMGASTEILVKASQSNLRIMEIPITIYYEGLRPSTQNPLVQGIDVVMSTIRQASMRRPALFYGVPALIFTAIGIFFGLWATQIYLTRHEFATNMALVAVASIMIGLILATTAIILFTIISVIREGLSSK